MVCSAAHGYMYMSVHATLAGLCGVGNAMSPSFFTQLTLVLAVKPEISLPELPLSLLSGNYNYLRFYILLKLGFHLQS